MRLLMYVASSFPKCPRCGGAARPAVYTGAGDSVWLNDDYAYRRLYQWLECATALIRSSAHHRLVILEVGVASDEHGPRHLSEMVLADTADSGAVLVRISATDASCVHNQGATVSIQQRPAVAVPIIDMLLNRRLPQEPQRSSDSEEFSAETV